MSMRNRTRSKYIRKCEELDHIAFTEGKIFQLDVFVQEHVVVSFVTRRGCTGSQKPERPFASLVFAVTLQCSYGGRGFATPNLQKASGRVRVEDLYRERLRERR